VQKASNSEGKMILIGQYDSCFVRRVGIALTLYGLAFEHRPWSVFGDAERLMQLNPLGSVPTLVLDDGTVLNDSATMLQVIDTLVPEDRRLWPVGPADRLAAQRVLALAMGLGDRMASLFYERRLHSQVSDVLAPRRERQIAGTLASLEAERAGRGGPWWFGASLGHVDIGVACVLRHLRESLPDMFNAPRFPALDAHGDRAEALAVFQAISQPFLPPA
jgi:glutathione S-transferase